MSNEGSLYTQPQVPLDLELTSITPRFDALDCRPFTWPDIPDRQIAELWSY
jgi:hypothetical protein